jgi:hypothetical protein
MMRYFAFALLTLIAAWAPAAFAYPIHYIPFKYDDGYREIRLAPDLYFVAFHGVATNDLPEVEAAWKTRAAELCSGAGYPFFMELKYSFEPVLKGDPALLAFNHEPRARAMPAGGVMYVPFIIPGQIPINWPNKQAHVRCVKDEAAALDPKRLMDARKIVQEGKARGWVGVAGK